MRYQWLWAALVLIGAGLGLRYALGGRPCAGPPAGSLIIVLMKEDLDARDTHLGARFEAVVFQPVHVGGGVHVLSPGMRLGGRVEGFLARTGGRVGSPVSGMVLQFDRVQCSRGRHEAIATRLIVWPPQPLGGLFGGVATSAAWLKVDEPPRLPRGQRLTVEVVRPVELPIQPASENRRIE